MQGVYADMQSYTSQEATVQPTTKLKKGVKALNVDIKDVKGTAIQISFGSTEWILPAASYTIAETVANKTCVVKVNGEAMKSGDIDVSLIGGKYYLNGLFANAAGQRVKLNYVGELAFVVGQDDPEASGYTLTIAPTQIVDWSTGAPVVVNPNATKYIISINNPAGQPAAYLEAVNANQLGNTDLAGEYTIQENASEPWLMGNGFAFPQYGFMGGSFFVDEAGVAQYIKLVRSSSLPLRMQRDRTYSHSRALTLRPRAVWMDRLAKDHLRLSLLPSPSNKLKIKRYIQ